MSKDTYYWECEDCGKSPTKLYKVMSLCGHKILCENCYLKELENNGKGKLKR